MKSDNSINPRNLISKTGCTIQTESCLRCAVGCQTCLLPPPIQPRIVASRGRNNDEGFTEQQLEMRNGENTNTITGVQKDNLVVTEKQPRVRESCIMDTDDDCATITGNVAKNSNAQPWVDLQLRDGRDNRSTLRSGRNTELGFPDTSIRRLTEIECERLQGFPDNHTAFGNYDGTIKKIPKTQRYKLMGNAVMVDCVEAIALRLRIYE